MVTSSSSGSSLLDVKIEEIPSNETNNQSRDEVKPRDVKNGGGKKLLSLETDFADSLQINIDENFYGGDENLNNASSSS